jgi:hypothetical protein
MGASNEVYNYHYDNYIVIDVRICLPFGICARNSANSLADVVGVDRFNDNPL